MTIDVKTENKIVTISPVGNIDYTNAKELEEVINKEAKEASKMIINLKDVNFVASAGLRTLLSADEIMASKEGLEIINVNNYVKDIFKMTGFASQLTIK